MKHILSNFWKARITILVLFASLLTVFGFAEPSQALCATDYMGGTWKNVDQDTRGITKIIYIPRCSDQILCSTDGSCTTPPRTSIHVFGACSPTDCDWGESNVEFHRNSNWRFSVYDQGFARKIVQFKLTDNDQLIVVVSAKYRDSREDRTSSYRLNRAQD